MVFNKNNPTLTASIFIPLTFLAGIYGMNFESMPELGSHVGHFVVLGVMIIPAVGIALHFRHRGWVGRPPPLGFDTHRKSEEP